MGTYSQNVRRALPDFVRFGPKAIGELAGDKRKPEQARKCLIFRQMDAECLSERDLVQALTQCKASIPHERAKALVVEGVEPTTEELLQLAEILHVKPVDLKIQPLLPEEEVVVCEYADAVKSHRLMHK